MRQYADIEYDLLLLCCIIIHLSKENLLFYFNLSTKEKNLLKKIHYFAAIFKPH